MCFPFFLFSFLWASPFVPFLFLCLSLLLFFLPSFLSFLFLLLAFSFCYLCFLLGSRFYFVVFFVSACCLVLFWIIMFDFLLFSILFSCCCFLFLLLSYFAIFENWQPIKKHVWKFWILQKSQKWKMHKKRTFWQKQLAQKCSQIVSFFLFCVSLNFAFFAENTIKIGVSAKKKKEKNTKKNKKPSVKNWSKLALKTGPIMLRNKIGPVFNARNGSFFFGFFLVFFEKSSSFCRENEIFKNTKKEKQKKLDQFLTLEKAKIGPVFNSTAYIYMATGPKSSYLHFARTHLLGVFAQKPQKFRAHNLCARNVFFVFLFGFGRFVHDRLPTVLGFFCLHFVLEHHLPFKYRYSVTRVSWMSLK